MEMEHEPHNEDFYMISRGPQVIPQSPTPPVVKPTLRKKGDFVPLDDDLVMDVYNLSFDEFQRRIIQPQRKNFSNDHARPTCVR